MIDSLTPAHTVPDERALHWQNLGGTFAASPISAGVVAVPGTTLTFALNEISGDLAQAYRVAHEERLVWASYLGMVIGYGYVRQVLSEREGLLRPRIWTVIDAPPFHAAYRRPIYGAQAAAAQLASGPVVDFRLLNIRELDVDPRSALPESYRTLLAR